MNNGWMNNVSKGLIDWCTSSRINGGNDRWMGIWINEKRYMDERTDDYLLNREIIRFKKRLMVGLRESEIN